MYDIVVIGAGIQGAGVAQAAVAAGYKVLVIEKDNIGSGTSQKSSKLIHGGLRYLETYQFNLVRECLKERNLLLKLAPDLIKLEKFYIPIYKETQREPLTVAAGLSLYWALSGLKQPFKVLPKAQWQNLDDIKTTALKSVMQYFDGQTDDLALTQSVMASAQKLGAELHCLSKVVEIQPNSEYCEVSVDQNGTRRVFEAKVAINCAGPWANSLFRNSGPPVELVKGSHLLLPPSLKHHYYLESPRDSRAIFALPWKSQLLLGTTETTFSGNPDQVLCQEAEQTYLLETLSHYFPNLAVDPNSVRTMAGLRVLPSGEERASSRPREVIFHNSAPRMLSIMGGKLTTYRLTAEKALNQVSSKLPNRTSLAKTAEIKLFPV